MSFDATIDENWSEFHCSTVKPATELSLRLQDALDEEIDDDDITVDKLIAMLQKYPGDRPVRMMAPGALLESPEIVRKTGYILLRHVE